MYKYLKEATNFTDMKKKSKSDYDYHPGESVECPLCKGYGGWILELNAYGDGSHFKASCRQCSGWGYVRKGSRDEKCIHKMKHVAKLGNCYNRYQCIHCGKYRNIDSSD